MRSEDVDFLRRCLELYPQCRGQVREQPLRLRWRGRWRRIESFRLHHNRLEFRLRGGGRVQWWAMGSLGTRRRDFAREVLRLCRRRWPSWQVERVLRKTDRARHQTGAFLRVVLRRGRRRVADLWVGPEELDCRLERLLSAALLWWDRKPAQQMRIFVPAGQGAELPARLRLLGLPWQCYQYEEGLRRLRRLDRGGADALQMGSPSCLYPHPGPVPPLFEELSRRHPSLLAVYRKGHWELDHAGLPVAWYETEGECFFDLRRPRPLESLDQPDWWEHLKEVFRLRRFPPPRPRHFLYRYAPERWLESLVLRAPHRLDPILCGPVYVQVPSWMGARRRVLDLLTVTKEGRLAVLELKAEKDLSLIFQGLEYWERVRHHQRRGDFTGQGYFPGLRLSPQPPLLYLVTPLFEFHRVLSVYRKYLPAQIQFRCLGINSDWRRGIRVVRRFRLRGATSWSPDLPAGTP